MMNLKAFLAEEMTVLDKLLERLGETSNEIALHASHVLGLAANVAYEKGEGYNVEIAEKALKAAVLNLKSAASMEVSQALLGYIQGAIIRSAKVAVPILLAAAV